MSRTVLGPVSAMTALVVIAINLAFLLPLLVRMLEEGDYANDFTYFWLGARLAAAGEWRAVFDVAAFSRAMPRLVPELRVGEYVYLYPPSFLVLTEPLGLMARVPAYFAWSAATTGLFMAVLYRLAPHRAVPLLALVSPGVTLNLWFGQNGLLTASLAAIAVMMAGRAPMAAGFALGLLTVKPHLAAPVALVMLAGGCWRALAAGAAVAAALLAASLFAYGPDAWAMYLMVLSDPALLDRTDVHGAVMRGSVYWTAMLLGGDRSLAWAAQAAAAVLAVAALAWSWRRPLGGAERLAVLAAAVPLLLPRIATYDLALMTVAAVAVGWKARDGAAWGPALLALALWLAPELAHMLAVGGIQVLAPVSGLLLVFALREARKGQARALSPAAAG